jgi:tetratricopeptide (TPR) repeat protein
VDPAIAVPPFRVQGEEMDLWREGMVDALSLYLDGVAGLRAIDPRTLMSRFRGRAGSGGALDLATTLAVAEQAGAQYALIGTGLSAGGQVRFTAELYAVDTPTPLNRLESAGDAADVLALVDRLGAETVFALADTGLELVPGIEIASGMTYSARALTAYLEGEALYRAGECTDAVVVLERAILEDPTFAMAHYRLALACSWGGPCFDRVTAYLLESLRLGLPERKSLPAQAWVAISDVSLAKLDALREGVLRYPEDPEVLQFLGENYYHLGEAAALEDWQAESERIFSRVIELDPGFAAVYQHPIQIAFLRGDSARAAALIEAAGAAEPDGSLDRFHRTLFGLAFGNL